MKSLKFCCLLTVVVCLTCITISATYAQTAVLCDKLIDRNGKKCKEGDTLPFTGSCIIKSSAGHIIIQTPYVDGLAEGLETSWYENGTKKWEIMFRDGKFNGKSTFYNENGNKRSEETYVNDYKFGKASHYYENGALEGIGLYDNCRESGTWIFYYPNGQMKAQGDFKAGIKIGNWKYWDEKGNVLATEPKE